MQEPQESQGDRYDFIVRRLKADIRFLLRCMEEFAEPSEGFWDQRIAHVEKSLEDLPDALNSDGILTSVDPIACLLNYRDEIVSQLLASALYEKAILYSDFQESLQLTPSSEPSMVEMTEMVARASKGKNRTERYHVPDLPQLQQPGPFTFDPKKRGLPKAASKDGSGAGADTPLQMRLPAALREMQGTDRALRCLQFGSEVRVKDKRSTGRVVDIGTIRKEITKLFDKCTYLEHELQTAKAQRSETDVLEQELGERAREKDNQFEIQAKKAGDLEGKVSLLASELGAVQREKAELFERYQKMLEESLPALDRIDAELRSSQEVVDRLHADAETLSSMFRLQVDDNKKFKEDREKVMIRLKNAHRQLKRDRDEGQFKDDELQKKETLYRCTVEAREKTLVDYDNIKTTVRETQERVRQQEAELQAVHDLVEGRDKQIQELKRYLQISHAGIDYLERQKKFCLKEFETAVGKPYSMLLEQYKDKPKARS